MICIFDHPNLDMDGKPTHGHLALRYFSVFLSFRLTPVRPAKCKQGFRNKLQLLLKPKLPTQTSSPSIFLPGISEAATAVVLSVILNELLDMK